MRGALATARAMATRCCSPPDSPAGRWFGRSFSPRLEQQLDAACGSAELKRMMPA
jgi:hypothetical protein